jgi:hypothetical protein
MFGARFFAFGEVEELLDARIQVASEETAS